VPDGTLLVGAKQNRVVGASILVPPECTATIPVPCVEQGRWRYRGTRFAAGSYHSPLSLRRGVTVYQRKTLGRGYGHRSDQGTCGSGWRSSPRNSTPARRRATWRRSWTLSALFEKLVRAVAVEALEAKIDGAVPHYNRARSWGRWA